MSHLVTVLSDQNLINIKKGNLSFLHVALRSEGPQHRSYFDFIPENLGCALTSNCIGKFSEEKDLENRQFTDSKTFRVSKEDFDNMQIKIQQIKIQQIVKSENRVYDRIESNCVTTSREVLNAGNISFLDDVRTPKGVSAKIIGDPSYQKIDRNFVTLAQWSPICVFVTILVMICAFIWSLIKKSTNKVSKRKFEYDSTVAQVVKKICI